MATKNQYETARHQHLSVGYDLAQKFLTGDKHLSAVTDDLSGRGAKMLHRKLVNMTGQWQSISRADNIDRLSTIIDALAFNYAGEKRDFHEFQALIEDEVAGFVVTAHPTFAMSKEAWAYAQDFMNGLPKSIKTPPSDDEVMQVHPDTSPTLHEELEYAKVALTNMRRALRTLYKVVFDRAAVLYPNEYRQLKPSLATIASWVGFDLDGRTDIDWSLGLLFRYRTAITGLNHCIEAAKILDIDDKLAGEHLEAIRSGFATLLSCFELGERELKSYQDDDQTLINFNVLTVKNQALKETARAEIAAALDALLAAPLAPADWRDVALLSTEWHSVGLGLSHIHFRLNAAQLHNAMGPEINLTKAPDQSAMRRHFLAAISDKLATVKPQSIHYGNLAAERTTAKRVFMMAAQFQKHFDAATPIRMLVAESDTPFTLLAALYYAKLFDVEAHVEISPLFETAIGLERGDRVIAELIDNPHFLAYIQNQGRFCIQLGFSDSGRYIGQPAASLAIERFKLRVVRLWKARGLGDIQLLFFDTHGESIGRGAYPESLKKRFLYTHPPRVRQALAELRRPEKHEVSFQGGEGYLWFLSEDTALATLTDFIDVRFGKYNADEDRLYDEKGWALDFFLTLVEYQNHLTDDSGYIRLIDSIGRSLLFPTGSRSMRRQGVGALNQRLERISQIRAIPNNAVLQQLGYMANSCAGLGTAIDRSRDKFNVVLPESDRLQMVTNMALHALGRSNIGIIESYAKLLSPGYWLDRLDDASGVEDRDNLRRLSKVLEGLFDSDAIDSCVRKLRRDASLMTDCLGGTCDTSAMDGSALDDELEELHQVRIALIQFIFMKSMEIPRFSSRFDFSLEELLVEILHLEVPATLERLRNIFPEASNENNNDGFGEDATYSGGQTSGYAAVHRQIFDQLEEAYDLLLRISGLIALKVGAFG